MKKIESNNIENNKKEYNISSGECYKVLNQNYILSKTISKFYVQ